MIPASFCVVCAFAWPVFLGKAQSRRNTDKETMLAADKTLERRNPTQDVSPGFASERHTR